MQKYVGKLQENALLKGNYFAPGSKTYSLARSKENTTTELSSTSGPVTTETWVRHGCRVSYKSISINSRQKFTPGYAPLVSILCGRISVVDYDDLDRSFGGLES